MRKPIHQPLGEGLRVAIGLAFCLSCVQLTAQQCPSIVNCPQSTLTYCDESTNQVPLWNYFPFTVSPSIGDNDLHEGPIDLNIKVKGCNGGGLSSISFILYLDLDNDDLQETVLKSSSLPPAGRVMANNSFNPGYSGGDTVWFDQRLLPDSMLYRFAIEIAYSGDTTTGWVRFCTDADPYNFSPVLLPEGRHRIEWRVAQDMVERFCDRNFKVKDCKKPTISCQPMVAVELNVNQSATLHLSDALLTVFDNITPDTQLVLGMRRVGTGFGFPIDTLGNPQDTVMYNCQHGENQLIEIWAKDKVGNLENCTSAVLVYDTAGVCPYVPFPSICARNYSNDEIIRDVAFNTRWIIPNQPPIITPIEVYNSGCVELNTLPPTSHFALEATKDTVPLNGVTTYDLVLISKHILSLEPFDAGWKIVAADANLSNSVTSYDIVELRKLILGLKSELPNSTPSWRFFVDTCTVWANPFFGQCPTMYSLPVLPISAYPTQLSFRGIKMGDVNGSASNIDTLQGVAESRGTTALLELPDLSMQAGELLEIPLRVTEGAAWEGFQFSMKFDPEILEIEEIIPGETVSLGAEHWAKPEAGVLNLSWSDAVSSAILPGDVLMRLRVKARSTARLSEIISLSGETNILPESYDAAGISHPLQLVFSKKANSVETGRPQVFDPMPNPTTGSAQLPLRLIAPEKVLLEISDLSGKILWHSASWLASGAHFLEIPAAAMSQSGIYIWRVCAGGLIQSGRLIRL
ncbi:MAG: hypothetical protein Q7T20_02520 [Saprospiraceae bacterium]|nr:hypothetical protein [Saprospiraceae bacterium]